MGAILERTAFSTSRLLEFFNEKELQMQIGHDRDDWPIALVKELIDNSLDACEAAGIRPSITVELEPDTVAVADNGPGLPADILVRSLDYSIRVSDKNHYISPTRGQLGNALKTVWAAPFAITGNRGLVEVSTPTGHYTIDVSLDRIAQAPVMALDKSPSDVKNGTIVKMHWPKVASYLERCNPSVFYNPSAPTANELLQNYALFNPHVTLSFNDWSWEPTIPDWQKWKPTAQTSPYWYSVEDLRNLAAAYVSAGSTMTVREFVSEFRGLTGTAKQKAVTDAAGLTGKTLGDLVVNRDFDAATLGALLSHMQAESRPVAPDLLGVIGEPHIRQWMEAHGVTGDSIEYRSKRGVVDGLPYVLEMAFGVSSQNISRRRIAAGLNWTPAIRSPFDTLGNAMSESLVHFDDPVFVVVHLACPKLAFTDRGKSRLMLPREIRAEFGTAFTSMTKRFTKAKRASAKQERMNERQLDDLRKKENSRQMTVKDACYSVMVDAYNRASSNGRYPANARQVMYAIRRVVLSLCGEFYKNSASFTQGILPDFQTDYPELTAHWDVVYDDRGHLIEPHTHKEIGLGTINVRKYIHGWTKGAHPVAEWPHLQRSIPTSGPCNRYGAVLFVEKEGFNQLLKASGIAERYDIAIESTKGQTVTAARLLAERYAEQGIPIFVLHDFDKSGIEIVASYCNDTRRYQYDTKPLIHDIGLRLADVVELGLQVDGAEEVTYNSGVHPRENLLACGATKEEIRFLVRGGQPKAWTGYRVELNALTSEQFVQFIERKLDQHGVKKVIPDDDYLEAAYRRAVVLQKMQNRIDEVYKEMANSGNDIEIPGDLRQRLEKRLDGSKSAWDIALSDIASECIDSNIGH